MSSLGFQLVYNILNEQEDIVCERFFVPDHGETFCSLESGRPLSDFSLVFISISFEHDYLNLVRILIAAGIEPLASDRQESVGNGSPIVVCGGVVSFMNPEPLAPFVDLFYVGEAETCLAQVTGKLFAGIADVQRTPLLKEICQQYEGCYAPQFYQPVYDISGRQTGFDIEDGLPKRIKKQTLLSSDCAGHSQLLTKEAEFSELFLTELGRGCSRGCRFCTAGFIYRPPRLWDADAIVSSLKERFEGVERIGLLGMEMASSASLDTITQYLVGSGCALSFSSLRADRLTPDLLELLSKSSLKSVAIAPDGCSERLRKVINKGLDEDDLLKAAENLVTAGIFKLKIYLMVGLPTECEEDLQEAIELIGKIKERIDPIGKERGRLCEIIVSVNSFAPKPWTPFQYHPFGNSGKLAAGETIPAQQALTTLKKRVKFLKNGLGHYPNVSMNPDKPENVLFQALLARGDRRVGYALLTMVVNGIGWKQALKQHDISVEQFTLCGYDDRSFFPWMIIDHGIKSSYLWAEYQRSFTGAFTGACDTETCKRCGVCSEQQE